LTCMTWVVLPGANAPASIAVRVIGAHKPPLHDEAVVHEEDVQGVDKIMETHRRNLSWQH
jgi:hypothetical protein